MRVVGDIGGTNTRLALCCGGSLAAETVRSFANDDWPHLNDIITAFLADHDARVSEMVIAVAGPVQGSRAKLTNRDWAIKSGELTGLLGGGLAHLLNDLSALGYAVPSLHSSQVQWLYRADGAPPSVQQSLVVGIGTGFNVSPVLHTQERIQCLAVEAGHMALPHSVSAMLHELQPGAGDYATVEDLFSGRGFTRFCQAVTAQQTLQGIDAIKRYATSTDPAITDAVDGYASLLGQLLQELTMAYMPMAGIYLAGSVARAIAKTAPGSCLKTFRQPGFLIGDQKPSLCVIGDDAAALHGCAAFQW